MAEFLELLETIEADVANTRNIFTRNDGTSVASQRNLVRGLQNPVQYKSKLTEAIKLLSRIKKGRTSPNILLEVMTTDDFPILFGDILDRTMLAKYQLWEVGWTAYAKRAVVNDFRDAELMKPLLGPSAILDVVPEADQYPDASVSEQPRLTYSVQKYGRRVPFSWETIINDNLNQLDEIPDDLATAARRTEQRLVTNLFVGLSGPNTSMYTVDNANIVNQANGAATNNPALSIVGLEDAYTVLSKMLDEQGNPIMRPVLTLVVPPALEVRARNILNATEIETTQVRMGGNPSVSDSGENRLRINNWMRGSLQVVVDPYIPMLATTANGNTSWFLFAAPSSSREAIRIAFLRGHETPEIWMKSPNAVRVGGGPVGPMSGDFDTDAIEYRIRHVTGVVMVDATATVMSNGSGS